MQKESELGLDAQLEMCKKIAESRSVEILAIYDETASGTKPPLERPVLCEAVAYAQSHQAYILVAKTDRFSRNLGEFCNYLDKKLWGYNTPPIMIAEMPDRNQEELKLWAWFAEMERNRISERTKAALAERYKDTPKEEIGKAGRIAHVQKAYKAVEPSLTRARELRDQGLSFVKIASTLNQEGFTTSTGSKWYSQRVHHYLASVKLS